MRRWPVVTFLVVALVVGALSIGLAQDESPPAFNAEGTPCASPSALVFASPGATMLASPEVEFPETPAAEPGTTPGIEHEETTIIDETCLPEDATPAP